MTIPFTSISLGFHSLKDPERSALHSDPSGTFARYGITLATYEGFLQANQGAGSSTVKSELAPAEKMLKTAIAIEEASKVIRDGEGNQPDPALAALIDEFLKMAASWVAAEVALGITAPDQPKVNEPGQLIRRMYLLLYSADFRDHPDRGDFDKTAWNALLKAVKDGGGKFDDLLPHCRTLCKAVADEFTAGLWAVSW
jgi:hypothetical protein